MLRIRCSGGLAETILSHHEEHEAHGAWRSADFRRFRFMNQEKRKSGNGAVGSCVPALTHVLPPIRPVGFPIYVARRPAAPFTRLNCPCPICVDPWLAFLRAKKAAGIFFVGSLSSTARSRRRVGRRFVVRYAQRLRRSGRAVAAARSTGLRPIHFIHFIAAAVTNRGPNLFEGMRNHYKLVMFGKLNFSRKITFRFARFEIVSARGP